MLDWLTGKKKNKKGLSSYARLQAHPNQGIPADLAEKEAGESHTTQRETIKQELCRPARYPPLDEPLFIELLSAHREGLVTLESPGEGRRCLPIFSTPLRALDYAQTLLTGGSSVQYLHSSPLELTQLLSDLRETGVEAFTLDRCPRCEIATVIHSDSAKTADLLLTVWAIVRATEITRANLYLEHANGLALAGQFTEARDVALETVGHVTMEDPRLHLLLGQLGIALKDRKLIAEAKAFLGFLKSVAFERKLDRAIQTGAPNFEIPELPESHPATE